MFDNAVAIDYFHFIAPYLAIQQIFVQELKTNTMLASLVRQAQMDLFYTIRQASLLYQLVE
jgi:hypothetical protein